MLGGPEETCIPQAHLVAFAKTFNRPCPRVDLEPENQSIGPMTMLALQPEQFGWALPALLAATSFPEPLRYVVWRIIGALSDDAITSRMEAKREAMLNEARGRR